VAVLFAWRSDQKDARTYLDYPTPSISVNFGSVSDSDAISGTAYKTTSGFSGAMGFPLGNVQISGSLDWSVLCRWKITARTSGERHVIGFENASNTLNNFLDFNVNTPSGTNDEFRVESSLLAGTVFSGTGGNFTTFTYDVNDFNDFLITYTESTNTLQVFHNASSIGTKSSALLGNFDYFPCLNVGAGMSGASASNVCSYNEIVIWDEIIDPTSVALVGGTGSLNGQSRTAFVDSVDTANISSGGGGGSGSGIDLGMSKGLSVGP
jgi:hypothetical protein